MTDETRAIDVAWPQETWRSWVSELQAEVERLRGKLKLADMSIMNLTIGLAKEQEKNGVLRKALATAEQVIETAAEADIEAASRWQQMETENATMREIVQAVADADPVSEVAREWSGVPGWLAVPLDVAWVTKARTFLENNPN